MGKNNNIKKMQEELARLRTELELVKAEVNLLKNSRSTYFPIKFRNFNFSVKDSLLFSLLIGVIFLSGIAIYLKK